MKNKLKKTLKFGILFFGITLLLWNCEKSDEISNKEVQQEKKRTEISFEQFKSNISSKEKLQTFNRFFDINKSSSKTTFNKKNINDFNDATILTENIIKIKKNDFTTYTFTILTQTENFEFYNLVLYVNDEQEIYKSHILKYTPSEKWLTDTTQHFSGNVKIINNDFFNVDNLLQSKSSVHAKSLANDDCIDSVTTEWECSFGYNHAPGTCNGTSFEYIITIEYGECSDNGGDNGGDNGDFDPETGGGEGGSTSGGGDGGIVTAPNTVPYTSQLKQFQSGTLNSLERTYYNRDSNIKNTIDRYLIQKSFSNIAKFNAKLTLEFSESLNLNFQQFNWAFNNRDSEDLNAITDYLNEAINITPEIEDFIKEVIDSEIETNNNAKVDFDDQIINTLTGKALCIYEKLESSSTGFKNAIKKFEPEFPVAHLKFDMGDIGASKGKTIAPNSNPTTPNSPDYVITVRLNNNTTTNGVDKRPNLLVVKTIAHEVIHAEMYRKLLSVLDNGGNIDGVTKQDVLDALDGNFPGMYDYYRRHKNWQHQQMATHYRETLARILQEYDTGSAVPDNQQPAQLYMDLSWEGLIYENGNNAIYTWTSLPQEEKERIKTVISDYIANNSNETCTE